MNLKSDLLHSLTKFTVLRGLFAFAVTVGSVFTATRSANHKDPMRVCHVVGSPVSAVFICLGSMLRSSSIVFARLSSYLARSCEIQCKMLLRLSMQMVFHLLFGALLLNG